MVKVKFDESKQEWIILPPHSPEGLYLDGKLKVKLDNIKKIQKKDWDFAGLIVGQEGSGKSTLSFIIAQYLTNMKLQLNQICSGAEDAIKKLKSLPDKSLIIIDEAELLFSSRETMKKEQRALTQIMMVIRQKGMILLLVSPSFHDLSKYIAVHRSRFIMRTYCDTKMNRGRFAYWGERRKKGLYVLGKKSFGSYDKPRANFRGKFTNYKLPFDDEYQKVKMKSLMEAFGSGEINKREQSNKWLVQRNLFWCWALQQKLITQRGIVEFYEKNGHKLAQNGISDATRHIEIAL